MIINEKTHAFEWALPPDAEYCALDCMGNEENPFCKSCLGYQQQQAAIKSIIKQFSKKKEIKND